MLQAAGVLGAGAVIGASLAHRFRELFQYPEGKSTDQVSIHVSTSSNLIQKVLSGIEAVENVVFLLNEAVFIALPDSHPIYRCLGDQLIVKEANKNAFGQRVAASHVPAGHTAWILRNYRAGTSMSTLVASADTLISMITVMYKLVQEKAPAVFHVVPGVVNQNSTFTVQLDEVLSTRQTGFAFLCSQNAQEAQDFAIIAHIAAMRAKVPFLHIFDCAYSGSSIVPVTAEKLRQLLQLVPPKSQAIEAGRDSAELKESPLEDPEFVPTVVEDVMRGLAAALGHQYRAFEYSGPRDAEFVIVALGGNALSEHPKVGILKVRLYRPFSEKLFLASIPPECKRIAVIDQFADEEFGPLFLDVVSTTQQLPVRPLVIGARYVGNALTELLVSQVIQNLVSHSPTQRQVVQESCVASPFVLSRLVKEEPNWNPEARYTKVLKQVLGDRLVIANVRQAQTIWGEPSDFHRSFSEQSTFGDVEYGYGVLLSFLQRREAVVNAVSQVVADEGNFSLNLRQSLSNWLRNREDPTMASKHAQDIEVQLDALSTEDQPLLQTISDNRNVLQKSSCWLVGSSNWAYDLSMSGIHHVIASKKNINLLIIDTECYSTSTRDPEGRNWKKDIGLYAMNYGGVYVASIAVYASYTQALRAIQEAEAFPGPSIVMAYAPQPATLDDSHEAALNMLKETKVAVDTGKWPLYRWNPEQDSPFSLDSQYIQQQLKDFLKRDNHLSLMSKAVPAVNQALSKSLNNDLDAKHNKSFQEATESYLSLLKGFSEPMLILFGSDGGNAKAVATKLTKGAIARGMNARCVAMNDQDLAQMAEEKHVVIVVSTAGQGEFPMNARSFWTDICKCKAGTFANVRFSVFAMGDRHYWPRPSEKIYFCKPGVDLDRKMAELGATRLTPVGLGDDQDEDKYFTGLKAWELLLWDALGLGGKVVEEAQTGIDPTTLKLESRYLRGTILQGLSDESTGALAESDTLLTKFHGIYQQDDRDLRESRQQQQLEPAYSFMVRVRVPGGVCTPLQYIAMDDLATKKANGTIKLTTRQAFQLHGIVKKNLKPAIAEINQTLMDTLAACGDVNRNVMCSPLPYGDVAVFDAVQRFARDISDHLSPRTTAYHEIWLDKVQVAGYEDVEPLYGPTYLPRKFKISVAVPPMNDVDCYAHCLNYVAVVKEGKVAGFNVLVGGGMGSTHNMTKTYPCVAQMLGYCDYNQAIKVGESVMLVQRDHGERKNRKHARMKYTVEDMGIVAFREDVESRCGFKLQEPQTFSFETNTDRYGWTQSSDGMHHYCMFIENGRIKDTENYPLRTALREIAHEHKGDFRLTPNANLIIGNLTADGKTRIQALMDKYKIGNNNHSGLRLSAMACAALPYCGLAFAESERYLPSLIGKLEALLEKAGLRDDSITMRMTGCPNGCARPFLAEVGFVGRAPGVYNLYLGAGHHGQRLNKLYKEAVNETQIVAHLAPLFARFAKERNKDEPFGDWVIRAGVVAATTKGPDFHANLGNTLD